MCSACVLWLNAYSYFPVLSSVHEISCVSVLRTSLNSPALGQDTWGPETDCQGLAALQKSWKPFSHLTFPVMEWKECSPNSAVSKTLSSDCPSQVPAYHRARGARDEKGEPRKVPGIHVVL